MKMHLARNDIVGGVIATLFALPVELVYGRIAVSPLGPLNFASGIQAAMWTCVMTGFLATLFRGTPGVINGSSSKIALILAALAAALLKNPLIMAAPNPAELVFVLLFICTALAGASQCLFALIKVGRTLKFIPYPVIAGTMIGSAALMAKTAFLPASGVSGFASFESFLLLWHPLSLVVTAATVYLCLRPPKSSLKSPFILNALIGGTLVHYLLVLLFGADRLGATWSSVDGLLPEFSVIHFTLNNGVGPLLHWIPVVLPYAVAIAAVASLESMLCMPTIAAATHRRPNSERELWTQGLSNVVVGLMGGFPSEAVASRSKANIQAGGHSRFSALIYSVLLAALAIFGSQLIGRVPEAVTAGLMLYLAYTLIDDGMRRLVMQLVASKAVPTRAQYRMLWANAIVILIVALVAIVGDMLKATGVGVIAGMALFIMTSMKPVIRTMATAKARRSTKVRSPEASQMLERDGGQIQIIELEGILFFGTAERVALEITALADEVRIVILDFGKVTEIDSTAARTLLQLARGMHGRGETLLLCGARQRISSDLALAGLHEQVPAHCWFADGDQALEAAEETLLAISGFQREGVTLQLDQTALAHGLDSAELTILEAYLERRSVSANSFIFQQGDAGDSLFVATSGVIDICLPRRAGQMQRVASFAPGVIVGEMAFLENMPRSAAGKVEEATELWELKRSRFEELAVLHPLVAHKVTLSLSRSLSERLRTTTQNLRAASAAGDFVLRSGSLPPGQVERRRVSR